MRIIEMETLLILSVLVTHWLELPASVCGYCGSDLGIQNSKETFWGSSILNKCLLMERVPGSFLSGNA